MSRMSEAIPDGMAMGARHPPINLFHVNGDQMGLARENPRRFFGGHKYRLLGWAARVPLMHGWRPLDLLDEVSRGRHSASRRLRRRPIPVLRGIPHLVEVHR
jgi:hypothetical protein